MRRTIQILTILVIFLATMTFSISQRNDPTRGRMGKGGQRAQCNQLELISALPLEELSPDEVAAINLMREEEKLARDVYLHLYEKWDLRIFWNIAGSEQRHMDAIGVLITKYEMDDPAMKKAGDFSKDFKALYKELTTLGEESLVHALTVGATIEDLDIYDLKAELKLVDNIDIRTVFQNLLAGSENHMRAFNRQLSANGIEYTAQYISPGELEEILSAPSGKRGRGGRSQGGRGNRDGSCVGTGNESGNGPGNGSGNGNGSGDGTCPNGN